MYRSRMPLLLSTAVVLASAAFLPTARAQQPAEQASWSDFKPGEAAQPAPAGAAKPAPSPAAIESLEPAPAAAEATGAPAAPAAGEVKETVLPGTEPHSPGTAGNALLARENLRTTNGLLGDTGLLRVGSAAIGRPGVVRLSLSGEYFTIEDFPVLGARNTRTRGTLAIDYTILDFLEAYLSYAAAANTNNESSPALMQSQGDINLGLKGGYGIVDGLTLGADLRLSLFPGIGAQDLRGYAFGFTPKLLATYDVRSAAPSVPLRVHLNLGGVFDSTGDLLSAHEPTPVEEYALGLNRYDRLTAGLGLEAPLPYATPFVEWNMGYPLGTEGLMGPDLKPVSIASSMPQQLSIGAKVTAIRDLTILAAVDIGLSRYVAKGIPATAPYNLVLGLGYAFDPMARGESKLVERFTVVEKKVEVATAPPSFTGKIAGTVVDAKTNKPIPGAIVGMAGSGLPPVASDAESGKYLTFDLPAGKAQLTFAAPGYKPAVLEAQVEVGKVTALRALLTPAAGGSKVTITLVSGKKKIAGKVSFGGPQKAEQAVAEAGASIELAAGHYSATVDAEGYLSKIKELDVAEGGSTILEIDLAPMPKKKLVVVKDDRIEIKQQVHFASGKAIILGDSHQLLDQIVDAIVRTNLKKVRVEGHTDNRGGKEANLKLSKARAEAVMEYLAKKGIDRARLSAEGFGDARPIAPNLTARGRELNRRVELVIVEH